MILSLIVLLLATAGLSWVLIDRQPSVASDEDNAVPARNMDIGGTDGPPDNAVAVLAFANLGGDEKTALFADGVAEEILNTLSRIPALRVASRTSAFSFRDGNADIQEIAAALGVRHVVEGSVRRDGDRLRVSAQLVEARTGFQRWSDSYEGAATDVFGFQDDIASSVADALGQLLGAGELGREAEAVPRTRSIAVYDRYILARQLWRERSEAPLRRSIALLEEVVAEEPDYAPGWSALAAANLTLVAYAAEPGDAWLLAGRQAKRALALDERQAEAHAVLASQATHAGQWLEAEARYQRARELAPSNSTIRMWHGEMLAKVGHLSRAIGEAGVALELDPLYTPLLGNAGHQMAASGRLDDAAELFQRAWDLGLEAMFVWFGGFYVSVMQQRFDDAGAWLDRRPIPYGIEADRAVLAYQRNPDAAHRRQLVDSTLAALDQGMAIREGMMYLALAGAVDEVFDRLLPEARAGWKSSESLWNDWTEPLRLDPRINEVAEAMGLVAYWQIHGPPDRCRLTGKVLDCTE